MLKNTSIVYIDGANVWYAQKYMGWLIDWKKLIGYLLDVLHNKFNKKVFVFSTNKFLSWELRKKADELFLLNKLKDKIFYKELTKASKGINIK